MPPPVPITMPNQSILHQVGLQEPEVELLEGTRRRLDPPIRLGNVMFESNTNFPWRLAPSTVLRLPLQTSTLQATLDVKAEIIEATPLLPKMSLLLLVESKK